MLEYTYMEINIMKTLIVKKKWSTLVISIYVHLNKVEHQENELPGALFIQDEYLEISLRISVSICKKKIIPLK